MKRVNWILKCTLTVAVISSASLAAATPRDREVFPSSGPRQESQFERNAREFKPAFEQAERQNNAEKMRDTTHDYRVRVGQNTSIGSDGKSVNVVHTFP